MAATGGPNPSRPVAKPFIPGVTVLYPCCAPNHCLLSGKHVMLAHNERYEVIATYADRDLLQSGWLAGEQTLAKKAAMVAAHVGDGKLVPIGFRTQHRAPTHGTYKLLFTL
jgi:hypothetical protein